MHLACNPNRPLWSENAGYPQIRRVIQTYPQTDIERSSPIEAVVIGQNPHDRSHPLPQLRETSLSCQLGPTQKQTVPTPKSQIVGIPPFSYYATDTRTIADTSFETPTGRNEPILPVVHATYINCLGAQIQNRWNSAVFRSRKRSGTKRHIPPWSPNPRETSISPGCARKGVDAHAQRGQSPGLTNPTGAHGT